MSYLDVSRINFDAGAAEDGTNVFATLQGATTYINSGGAVNSVTVGFGSMQNILGPLNIQSFVADCGIPTSTARATPRLVP